MTKAEAENGSAVEAGMTGASSHSPIIALSGNSAPVPTTELTISLDKEKNNDSVNGEKRKVSLTNLSPRICHKSDSVSYQEIPTFHLDDISATDPISFVESVKDVGQKYGAVKLVMPKNYQEAAAAHIQMEPSRVSFQKRQLIRQSPQTQIKLRLRFYNELISFHISHEHSQSRPVSSGSLSPAPTPTLAPPLSTTSSTTSFPKQESKHDLSHLLTPDDLSVGLLVSQSLSDQSVPSNSPKHKFPGFLTKLPLLDKRPIDVFDLFRLVVANGGYEEVVSKKLWAQVGRDLGYKGNITTSLSTSLKSSYAKILYPFELSLGPRKEAIVGIEPENESLGVVEEPPAKKSKKEPLVLSGSGKDFPRSVRVKASKGILLNDPHLIDAKECAIYPNSSELPPPISLYLRWIAHSSSTINDSASQALPSTSPFVSSITLQQLIEKDARFQESLLRVYPDILRDGGGDNKVFSDLELLYWQEMSQDGFHEVIDGIGIENPSSVPLHILGSGISRLGDELLSRKEGSSNGMTSAEAVSLALDPFNVHNLPILPNSLLAALTGQDLTNQDVSQTAVKLSMTFGFENWHCEDHFMQKCNYNLVGGDKQWYFIPETEFSKFEAMVEDATLTVSEENNGSMSGFFSDKQFVQSLMEVIIGDDETLNIEYGCLMRSLERVSTSFPEVRALINDEAFLELMQAATGKSPIVNKGFPKQEIVLTPHQLHQNGIAYTGTVQRSGEMIFTFPKTYSSTVSFGVNVSEETNFASSIWLDYAMEGEKWLRKRGILPGFSFFRMASNLAVMYENNYGIFDSSIYEKAAGKFEELVNEELRLRGELRRRLPRVKEVTLEERHLPDAETVSDDDFLNVFPSKVVLTNVKTQALFTMSLQNAIMRFDGHELGRFVDDAAYRIDVLLFVTDERLRQHQRLMASYSVDFDKWLADYDELMERNDDISLKTYRQLLTEGQRIEEALANTSSKLHVISGRGNHIGSDLDRKRDFHCQVGNLKRFVEACGELIEECQSVLSLKHQQRIRGSGGSSVSEPVLNAGVSGTTGLSQLVELVNKIPQANLYCLEFDQVFEFKAEIENFDRVCRAMIARDGREVTMAELDDMINLGTSFGIQLPSLEFLTRIRNRKRWLRVHDIIVEGGDPFAGKKELYSLEHLKAFRDEGASVLAAEDLEQWRRVQEYVIEGEAYDSKVQEYLSRQKKLNYVDLSEVDALVDDMEERAKKAGTERLFVVMETYQRLLDLKSQAKLIRFLQGYNLQVQSLVETRQMIQELRKCGFDFDGKEQIEADVAEATRWTQAVSGAIRAAKTTSGGKAKKSFDAQSLKQSGNADLTKSITLMLNKCMENFALDPTDAFTRSSGYMAARDMEPDYLDDVPLRYCFCREHEDGTMVECDQCHEWYHMYCVREKSDIAENDDKYTCPVCRMVNAGEVFPEFVGERVNDLTLEKLLIAGNALKVRPIGELNELTKLTELVGHVRQEFLSTVSYTGGLKIAYMQFLFTKLFGAPVMVTSVFYDKFHWLSAEASAETSAEALAEADMNTEVSEKKADVLEAEVPDTKAEISEAEAPEKMTEIPEAEIPKTGIPGAENSKSERPQIISPAYNPGESKVQVDISGGDLDKAPVVSGPQMKDPERLVEAKTQNNVFLAAGAEIPEMSYSEFPKAEIPLAVTETKPELNMTSGESKTESSENQSESVIGTVMESGSGYRPMDPILPVQENIKDDEQNGVNNATVEVEGDSKQEH